MTKSIAIRYSLAYLIMWAILGVVVLENAPGGDLTQAGLLKGVIMFHAAVAMTAAMEALARAAWSPPARRPAAPEAGRPQSMRAACNPGTRGAVKRRRAPPGRA